MQSVRLALFAALLNTDNDLCEALLLAAHCGGPLLVMFSEGPNGLRSPLSSRLVAPRTWKTGRAVMLIACVIQQCMQTRKFPFSGPSQIKLTGAICRPTPRRVQEQAVLYALRYTLHCADDL